MSLQTGGSEASARPAEPVPSARRGRAPRVLRWLLIGTVVAALVIAVCAWLLVQDARTARDALEDAADAVPEVERSLREGLRDPSQDGRPLVDSPALAELQVHTGTARDATDGVLWRLAAYLPQVGPSVDAATTVASTLDDVSGVVLPALAATGDAGRATTVGDDGSIDLAPLASASDGVSDARGVLADAQAELADVDVTALQSEFVDPVVTLREQLGELDGLLAGAERATTLLPSMLGAEETRRYVLLSLTNAELRTSGGIPGALMLLEVEDGRMTVTRQVSSGQVGPFDEPVVPLDPADETVFTDRLARYVQDVTMTPDFATTGTVTAQMWHQTQGEEVDGVIATDPVALSRLLEVTGPIDVALPGELADAVGSPTLTVESSTVVDLLLRRAYELLSPEQTDVFFAAVASGVVEQLTTGAYEPTELLPVVERIAESHRLQVWSSVPEEQELLTGTLASGTFGAPRAADAVGMFLDDTRAGKMSAYLETTVELAGSECTADGRLDTVSMTLTNTLDQERAAELPFYVAGPEDDPDRGTQRLVVTSYGADGAGAPAIQRDGSDVAGELLSWHGRQVTPVNATLRPGESTTIRTTFPTTAPAARGDGTADAGTLEVWTTPTAGTRGLHVLDVPVCG